MSKKQDYKELRLFAATLQYPEQFKKLLSGT